MNYNVYPYLDKRSTGKDGKHPIKIAIGYNRKADYINMAAYATTQEWQQLFSDKVPKHLKELKNKIMSTEANVRAILATTVRYDIKIVRKCIADLTKPILSPNAPITSPKPADVFHWFDIKIHLRFERRAKRLLLLNKSQNCFVTLLVNNSEIINATCKLTSTQRHAVASTVAAPDILSNEVEDVSV